MVVVTVVVVVVVDIVVVVVVVVSVWLVAAVAGRGRIGGAVAGGTEEAGDLGHLEMR